MQPPSFPRKRESSTSVWIPGLRFTAPGMTGERGRCFLFPLCQVHEHGWRPAGFAPLPWGRVPYCLQQQKGTVTTHHGRLLFHLCVIFVLARLHTACMRPRCARKCLDLKQNPTMLSGHWSEKMPPTHPAISCASQPGRGSADAFLRAADVSHPWLTPAGLTRPGLRCSGGTKGELARISHHLPPSARFRDAKVEKDVFLPDAAELARQFHY